MGGDLQAARVCFLDRCEELGVIEAIGLDGGVRFSTKNPKLVEVFAIREFPGEQESTMRISWIAPPRPTTPRKREAAIP